MTTVDKYCATCGVRWSGYGGFYHTIDCPQYMKQSEAEALDHVDYTPPNKYTDEQSYIMGWNDAIKRVMEKIGSMNAH
jgi:hypothetical protein